MRKSFMVLLMLYAAPCIFAQDKTSINSDEMLRKSADHFYNHEYQEAETLLRQYINAQPHDPRGYWRLTLLISRKTSPPKKRIEDKDTAPRMKGKAYQGFLALVATGIEKAEAQIQQNPDNEEAKFIKGSLYALEGAARYENEDIILDVFGMRRAIAAGKSIKLAIYSLGNCKLAEAKLPLGIIYYNIGSRWAGRTFAGHLLREIRPEIDLTSIENKEMRRRVLLEFIAEAYGVSLVSTNMFRDDAVFAFFNVLVQERLYDEAVSVGERLCASYPRNEILKSQIAYLHTKTKR